MNTTIILVISFVIVILLIIMYNEMLKKKNNVKNAFSSMDVILKKRADLMPNLASMVKKYMTHENDVFTKLAELRSKLDTCNSINDSIDINKEIDNTVKRLNVSIEAYPELKANQSFLHMQNVLNDVEEQISAARRTYNAHVNAYNTFIGMIPMNIFARLFGYKEFKLFEISELERESKIWM